jgi:steroid delta-isomerase-like uncharacterized protein
MLFTAVLGWASAQSSTVNVLHELRDAQNAGDVEAFIEHFHDDAEVTVFGPQTARFEGIEGIRAWQSHTRAVNSHLELFDCEGQVVVATCHFAVASDVTRQLDLGVLLGSAVAKFDGDKITSFTVQFDDTDLVRFEAAIEEANKSLYRRLNEALNSQNLDDLDALVAEDVVDHDPLPGQAPGREGLKDALRSIFEAFPDAEIRFKHLVADGNLVIAHVTVRGTHQGEFMGVPPTGKRVSWDGFDVGRIQNGVFVERWGLVDTLGLLQQLGAFPPPGQ